VKRFFLLTCLLVALGLSSAWGGTLKLKNGTEITGTLVSATADTVVIRDDRGTERTFNMSEVESMNFGDSNASPARSSTVNDSSASSDTSQANTGTSMTVPVGSEIAVRTNETIDSNSAQEGQRFSAVLASDVVGSSGEVLIPKGADAQLVLRQVSTGGTTGSPDLTLDLQSITVGGHGYEVSTSDLEQKGNTGLGKNRRTATMVGGGAVLGTLLGAIAGGGKGAAIGAVGGAAAGGTAQVLTKGKNVKVPAETVLTFRLDQSLRLDPVR
jgi:hypothetical protein